MRTRQPFDYYVRAVTTSILALGLVGAAVFALLEKPSASPTLLAWAGVVVGVYFLHYARNGSQHPPPPPDDTA